MTLRKGLPAKNAATDADDTRYDFRNLFVANADGSPRGGITAPVGTALLSSTDSMAIAVADFAGAAIRDGGPVLLANDGTTNVTLDPAPSSQSRLDVVFAVQHDSSSTVSVPDDDDDPVFGVLKGVAAANPVRNPDGLPAGALELGTVLVPSTATTTSDTGVVITTTAPYTAGAGGKVPFRTYDDLQLWTTAQTGQSACVTNDSTAALNGDYVWSGSVWGKRLQGGTVQVNLNGAASNNNTATVTVTFPVPMVEVPSVSVQHQSANIGATWNVYSVSTTGFTLTGHNAGASSLPSAVITVGWIAIA